MLTASQLGRQFTYLLSQKFGPIEFSPEPASFIADKNQCHADFMAEPSDLKGLDALTPRLEAYAERLAEYLKQVGAIQSIHLSLPVHAEGRVNDWATHRYNGMSVRCIMHEPWLRLPEEPDDDLNKIWAIRFDVLYRRYWAPASANPS